MRGPLAELELAVARDPEAPCQIPSVLVDMLSLLDERFKLRDVDIAQRAKEEDLARRLTSIPGAGPVVATAVAASAPPAETFRRRRDFAVLLGLTPPPLQRREIETWRNLEDGRTNAAASLHHRYKRHRAFGREKGYADTGESRLGR